MLFANSMFRVLFTFHYKLFYALLILNAFIWVKLWLFYLYILSLLNGHLQVLLPLQQKCKMDKANFVRPVWLQIAMLLIVSMKVEHTNQQQLIRKCQCYC